MIIELPAPLRRNLKRRVWRAGRCEIGGILMAEQIEPGRFRLAEFTVDNRRGSAAHFVRSVDEHRRALEDFFLRTRSNFSRFNYIGEWHSHPNHLPVPSAQDIRSMQSLVEGENDIPFAVLLIVRTKWLGLMLSATLFQRDGEPAPIDVRLA